MSDRNAKLSIETDASSMGKAAGDANKLVTSIEKVGDAGDTAASDLKQTSAAIEAVAAAEGTVAQASDAAAGALAQVGVVGVEAASATVTGAQAAKDAVAGVAAAAGEEVAALAAAGATAVESSGEAAQAINGVADAEAKAAAEAKRFADEARKAAKEGDGFRSFSENVNDITTALRASDLQLEVQRVALTGIIAETEEFLRSQIALGEAGKDRANDAGKALTGLRANLKDVNKQIDEQINALRRSGDAGAESGANISAAEELVAQRIALATAALDRAEEQFATTGRIGVKSVKEVDETIEALNIAIEQTGTTTEGSSAKQVAAMDELLKRQNDLNATAQRLTNSSKNNSVALQDEQQQIAGVANATSTLLSVFDAHSKTTTAVIGKTNSLIQSWDSLKKTAVAMDLNTVSAGASLAKLGTQTGLYAVVAAVAAAAGMKVASANKQNAETTDGLWKSVKKFASDISGDLTDSLSGWQQSLQSILLATNDVILNAAELGTTEAQSRAATNELAHAFNEAAVAAFSGASGVKLYNVAIRDGLSEEQARKIAIEDSARVMKFYEQSQKGGAEGHALWVKGLRESEGDNEKFIAFINKHNAEMVRAATLTGRVTDARNADRKAANELRGILDQLDAALPNAEGSVAGMLALADALEETAGKVKGLSKEEKERLQIIVDLLRRGADLTDEQKRLAAGLLQSARAGKDASATYNALVRLQLSLTQANNGTSKSLAEAMSTLRSLTGSWELNSQAIREAIGIAQAALDSTDRLTDAQRRQHQQTIDGLRAMDAARAESAAMESQRTATLVTMEDELQSRWHAASDAIQQRLADLAELVPKQEEYGGVVRDLAGQISALMEKTNLLSETDRGRLDVIVSILEHGGKLTASQEAYASALIASALAETQATTSGNALARIQADIDHAVGGTTERLSDSIDVLATLTQSWDLNEAAIAKAVAEYGQILQSTDGLTAAQKKLYGQIVDGIQKIDALTKSQADLEAKQQDLLDTIAGGTKEQAAAAYAAYEANQKEIFSIQSKTEATKGLTQVNLEHLKASKDVVVSTNELVRVGDESSHTFTNIGTAQKNAAQQTGAVGQAAATAADQVATAGEKLSIAAGAVGVLGDAAGTTAGKVRGVGTAFDDTASELSASSQQWVTEARKAAAAAQEFEPLKRVLKEIEDGVDRVMDKFGNLPKVIAKSAADSAHASGFAQTKVREAG